MSRRVTRSHKAVRSSSLKRQKPLAPVAPAKSAPKPQEAPAARPAPVLAAVPAPSVPAAPAVARTELVSPAPAPGTTPHASPSVRKFARELGVDLIRVKGSGPKGRITQADVQEFVKGVMRGAPAVAAVPARGGLVLDLPEWPQVDFAKFGPVEAKPLSRIRKLSGGFLHRNWVSIPHVTQHDEADITELETFRKENAQVAEKGGFKLTMLAFLVKASVNALKEFTSPSSRRSARRTRRSRKKEASNSPCSRSW